MHATGEKSSVHVVSSDCWRIDRPNGWPEKQRSVPPHPGSFMTTLLSPKVLPVVFLIMSNVFMTFAWYGHLKFKTAPLYAAVLFSWGLAFFEYWLAVPANRIGHQTYSAAELKTMQEVITLAVFVVFSVFYLKEAITWNHALGFVLIAGGAALIFKG
jgi:uncharacterized protein (DUF486 family)